MPVTATNFAISSKNFRGNGCPKDATSDYQLVWSSVSARALRDNPVYLEEPRHRMTVQHRYPAGLP